MKRIYLGFVLILSSLFVQAATVTWSGGGDGVSWSDALNWSPNQVPTNVDDVFISDVTGDYAYISTNQTCNSITFTSDNAGVSIDNSVVNTGITLTVLGNIDFGGFIDEIFISDSEVLQIGGEFLNNLNAVLTSSAIYDAASVVEYNGSVTQNIWGVSYGKLILSGTGNKVLNDDITITSRGVVNGTGLNCFVSTTTGTVTFGGSQITTFTNNGATGDGSGTVTAKNTRKFQNIPALSFNNLVITGTFASSKVTFQSGATTIINGQLTLPGTSSFTSGVLDFTNAMVDFSNTSGTVTIPLTYNGTKVVPYTNVELSYSGVKAISGAFSGATLVSLDMTNIPSVLYNGANQTVINGAYDELSLSGTTSNTKTIAGVVSANTFNITNTKVSYTGSAAQTILPGTYTTITLSGLGAKNIYGTISCNIFTAGSTTINNSGLITANTFNSNTSTVNYNLAGDQSISPFAYYNLTLSGSGNKTISSNLTVTNNLQVNSTVVFETGSNTVTTYVKLTNNGTINKTSGSLTLRRDFENNGLLTLSSISKLIFSTSSSSIFSGTSPVTARLVELTKTSMASLTLNNVLNIEPLGSFKITNATSALVANGNLVLNADVTGYSTIPAVSTGSTITGAVTAEAYVPASIRTWWHLCSPISAPAASQWIDDIYITGTFTGNSNATIPGGSTGQSSIYYYNETDPDTSQDIGWMKYPVADVSENMTNGLGYRVFIRDSKTTASPKTIDLTGTLNYGAVSIPLTYTNSGNVNSDGWNFIGNPYPASLKWTSLRNDADLLDNNVYIWNAITKTYDFSTSKVIAPFQGFWVQAQNNGALDLTETMKSTTSVSLQRPTNVANLIEIEFVDSNVDPSYNIAIAELVVDPLATLEFDNETDVSFLSRNFMSEFGDEKLNDIAIQSPTGKRMKKNHIPESTSELTIPLYLEYSDKTNYTITITATDFVTAQTIILVDNFTNTEMIFEDTYKYSFVASDLLSKASDRFILKVGGLTTGIDKSNEKVNATTLDLFPNPVSDELSIKIVSINNDFDLAITDVFGNERMSENVKNTESSLIKTMDVSALKSGVYFVKLKNREQILTQKFIIK